MKDGVSDGFSPKIGLGFKVELHGWISLELQKIAAQCIFRIRRDKKMAVWGA